MRQLFLVRGPDDEVHKGMTGNTTIIAQHAPSYEQVLSNMSVMKEGLVVMFSAVPYDLVDSAQAMPEVATVQTTMQGPANRIPMFCRQEQDAGASATAADESCDDDSANQEHAAEADRNCAGTLHGGESHPIGANVADHLLSPDSLNENETIIGMGEECCPKSLRL